MWLPVAAAAPLTWSLVYLLRRELKARGIMDVPNDRSSHAVPTPRGGGLGIVLVTTLSALVAWATGALAPSTVIALLGGGIPVAFIGWMDDRKGLRRRTRLLVHMAAAVWAVVWLGGYHQNGLLPATAAMDWLGYGVSVLVIAWAINAYNFMDGIDGLAGSEAVWVGMVGGVIALAAGHPDVGFIAMLLAATSLGFLVWNLPPAKLFLGDVGSGFLGYSFAVLALFSESQDALPAIGWLVLLGVFAFDSTVTLGRRFVRGEAWYSTHRSSAYQRVAARLGRHGPVTLTVLAANILLAALCSIGWAVPGTWAAVALIAFALLVLLYVAAEKFSPMAKG